ncbi:hypothetical protein RRG08_041808 [Elysia crispata]|uniref:Uncharacterized protein n=1 Tax=Elysia crispata TaxID=231223 RepID=A0AAE0YVI8_9GAST|nr:hypothetical protein RRG08_041808 [Elysia crispata]
MGPHCYPVNCALMRACDDCGQPVMTSPRMRTENDDLRWGGECGTPCHPVIDHPWPVTVEVPRGTPVTVTVTAGTPVVN